MKKKILNYLKNEDGFIKKGKLLKSSLLIGSLIFTFDSEDTYAASHTHSSASYTVEQSDIPDGELFCISQPDQEWTQHGSNHGSHGKMGHSSTTSAPVDEIAQIDLICFSHKDSYTYSTQDNELITTHSHALNSPNYNKKSKPGHMNQGSSHGSGLGD